MDSETCAADMAADNIFQEREQQPKGRRVVRVIDVALERVKEPQRRVGCMAKPLILAFGKQIGDKAIACVMGKGAQDGTGFADPPGNERQPFKRNHCVAAPICEPVVAGDDSAHLVALRPRPGDVGDPADWCDDEGVRCQRQLSTKPGAGARRC